MTKTMGRPKEKDDASKITLYLEDTVIETLNRLATTNRTSRSRIVENLVRQKAAEPSEINAAAAPPPSRGGSGHARGEQNTPPPALPHPDLEKAVRAAENIVEKAPKRGSQKRK